MRSGINLSRSGNNCGRMNSGGEFLFREKQRQRLGKGHARVGNTNQDFLRRIETLVSDDGSGGALLGFSKIFFIFREGEIAGLRVFRLREIFQDGMGVADDFALKVFCDCSSGKGHLVDLIDLAHYKDGRSEFNPYFYGKNFACGD